MGRLNEKRGKKNQTSSFLPVLLSAEFRFLQGGGKWWSSLQHLRSGDVAISLNERMRSRSANCIQSRNCCSILLMQHLFYKHLHGEEPRVGVSWPLVSSQSPTGNKGSDEPSGSASISTCTCFNSRISVCLKAPWVGFQLCHVLSLQKKNKNKNLTASVMIGVCVTVWDVA